MTDEISRNFAAIPVLKIFHCNSSFYVNKIFWLNPSKQKVFNQENIQGQLQDMFAWSLPQNISSSSIVMQQKCPDHNLIQSYQAIYP